MIDLDHIIRYRENNRIEAKKALGGLPHSIWETYSAFANTLGGLILLGVEEYRDKTLHPIDLPDPERLVREFWALVNDPAKASVNVLSAKDVTVEDAGGKRIVVVNVPRADRACKPVYLDGDPANAYRRNGEGDYRCTAEDLQAMARDAAQRTQDMRVLEDAELQPLCGEALRAYRARMRAVRPGHAWETLSDAAFLEAVGAAAKSGGTLRPTAAGLLMFGRAEEILRFFPRYSLRFRTASDPRSRWIDAASGGWSGGVLDFYFRVSERLRRSLRLSAGSETDRAFREALVNCLSHADYCERGGVAIVRAKDRVSFSNPGAFRIDPEIARGGRSDPRNGAMLGMFRLIDAGAGAGGGLPTIYRVWRSRGRAEPSIRQSVCPDRTTLTLPLCADAAPRGGMRLSAGLRDAAVQYLTEAVLAGSADVARRLGVSVPRARTLLNGLVEDGFVIAEKRGRERKYRLKW